MRENRALLRHILLFAGIAAALASCARARIAEDLTSDLESARRQPADAVFDVVNAESDHGPMRCVRTHGATRLTYHVTVPSGATLSVWTPATASSASDAGVAYLVGLSDGHAYRTVTGDTTEPASESQTAQWRNSRFRLDEYAGMTINVVFNTRSREPSTAPPGAGLWCSPAILVR